MIDVSAFRVPWSWVHGGTTCELRIFSNVTWTDDAGDIHLAGIPGAGQPCQVCPGTVADRIASILSFQIAPTIKANGQSASVDRNNVRLTGVLFDQWGRQRETLFENFRVPENFSPLTWTVWTVFNRSRVLRLASRYITEVDVLTLLAEFTGTIQAASDVILGAVYTDVAPDDPGSPKVVGINSPLLAKPVKASGRVVIAQGYGPNGESGALVATSEVDGDSNIVVVSQDDGVTGTLRASYQGRVDGVSFPVYSTNGADAGIVAWFLYKGD